jgi:hypothetical protein
MGLDKRIGTILESTATTEEKFASVTQLKSFSGCFPTRNIVFQKFKLAVTESRKMRGAMNRKL